MVENRGEGHQQIVLNDFRRQWSEVATDAVGAVQRVGESGWYILGCEVREFERQLASYLGRTHAIGCANGLDAIEIGLRSMGLRAGDRVLTTPLSAFATTLAIVRAGGRPVFVDVDAHGLIDLGLARKALTEDRSIRYFVPVHLYGHSLDLAELSAIKRELGVQILEDACQAIGAKWRNLPVGSVGEVSALSFYPTKNLGALGDAGAVLTDMPGLAATSSALRDYGQSDRYHHNLLGLNSRLDELHAAMLQSALLPRLAGWTARRLEVAQAYLSGIEHDHVQVPGAPVGSDSVWHLFPLLVPASCRVHFREHLARAGVASAIHYPKLIADQPALEAVTFEALDTLERARHYCDSEVSIPIHPYLTNDEVNHVIEAVNSWRAP